MKPRELVGDDIQSVKDALELLLFLDDYVAAHAAYKKVEDKHALIRSLCLLVNLMVRKKFGKDILGPEAPKESGGLYGTIAARLDPTVFEYEEEMQTLELLRLSLESKASFFLKLYSISSPLDIVTHLCDIFYRMSDDSQKAEEALIDIGYYVVAWLGSVPNVPDPY